MSSTSSATTAGYLNTATTISTLTGQSSSPVSFSGLSSGINTQAIINALMSQAAQPQAQLQTQLTQVNTLVSTWQALSADATQLQSAADAVSTPADWSAWVAQSSSTAVTATTGPGAVGGSLTFTVNSLAAAAADISSGSVSSTASSITAAGQTVLVAGGGAAIGLTSFSGTLAAGSHTVSVTQASAAATRTGTALGQSNTINSGDSIGLSVDGTSYTLNLAAGTNLTPTQVAAEVAAAAKSAGAPISASISNSGQLVLATTAEGSSHSIQVTGGTGLSDVGLSVDTSASYGTDGIVSVDGTTTTLNNVTAGASVTLAGPGGASISATLTGGLRDGSVNMASVSTGDGSLGAVVSAINNANVGITASAVQTGTGSYRLQLGSNTTGASSSIDVAPGAFSGIGTLTTLTAGADASLTVGTGPGAFAVTSSSNTVTGLMPGVSLNLVSTSSSPVTVSLSPDGQTMASKVSTLVNAANAMIKDLNMSMALDSQLSSTGQSSTSSTSNTPGPLLGDPTASAALDSVLQAVSGSPGAKSEGSAGLVGVTMNNDGTLNFDQNAFLAAYQADPKKVANTFTQGATATDPNVSFYEASDYTQAGTYSVNVTAAATQATDTGANLGSTGTVSTAETISLTAAGATATYTTTAGESLSAIVSGINTAAGSKNLGLVASANNGALQIQSSAYGSSASFQVSSSATGAGTTGIVAATNTPQTFAGTDVAGTINGTAATGSGQLLIGAVGTPEQGLLLNVTATAAQVSSQAGNFGTVSYTPGLAQALATTASNLADPVIGTFTQAITGEQSQASTLKTEIANWNPVLAAKQQELETEYLAMETSLSVLKSTQTSVFGTSGSSSSQGG